MPHRKKAGFTLIEMLIVIVIIGILAAALIPRLQSVQGRARDTKRKTDIAQIHQMLLIYQTDNGVYPIPGYGCPYNAVCSTYSSNAQPWITGLANIATSMPIDPLNVGTQPWANTGDYLYWYSQVRKDGKAFHLAAHLENRNDPDRCGLQGTNYISSSTGLIRTCQTVVSCGEIQCPYLYMRSDVGP